MSQSNRQVLEALLAISDESLQVVIALDRTESAKADDHLVFMAYTFVHGQLERLQSIITLAQNGHYRDTKTIMRTMVEGFALFQFAKEVPNIRPYRWRAFAWVIDFRQMNNKELAAQDVVYGRQIQKALALHRDVVIKPKLLDKPAHSLGGDPYIKVWNVDENGNTVAPLAILKKLQLTDGSTGFQLLVSAYEASSKRIHWHLQDAGTRIRGGLAEVTPQDASEAVESLNVALFCLYDALLNYSQCFDLQIEQKIGSLAARTIKCYLGWRDV